jgi:hypothetical protein
MKHESSNKLYSIELFMLSRLRSNYSNLYLYRLCRNGIVIWPVLESFVFSIQNQCQLANQIISVERVNQYMDIPSEAGESIEENWPSPDWPQADWVELRDLKVTER